MQKQLDLSGSRHEYRIEYEKSLNPSQLEAVTFTEGPLLVIAGAGSGKTRTIIYRVARLVEDGVQPGSLLLLTFTRRASFEMLKKASELLDNRCARVSGGTFHSFANTVLQKYASLIGFEQGFSILDSSDAESLIGILRKESGLGSKHRLLPKRRTLANIFSKTVNKVLSIEDVVLNDYPQFIFSLDDIILLYNEYKNRKANYNFFDYDDLLIYLRLLLKDHSDIRLKISSSYQYIMVDEYQDTNQLQAEIIYLLAENNKNIMVVGDDSQSIYAFRGANFKNIMMFPQQFPGTKIIKLEENYRSVQPILNLTNAIINQAEEKYSKTLFTKKSGGSIPVLVSAESENDQSVFVVENIIKINQKGVPLNEIAVLFRAGFHSFDLEIELGRKQIPFIKVGGFKFVESAHIKDVLAYLKIIYNPYDRVSWYRILLLLDTVGAKTAQNIYEAIASEASGYMGLLCIKLKPRLEKSLQQLKELFSTIDTSFLSVAQTGEAVLNYYAPVLEKKFDNHPKRLKDLEQLITIMQRYSSMEQFLSDMALEPPNTGMDDTFSIYNSNNDRLVLSTIHSAKGLEWHSVFVIWALDGRFPSIQALRNDENLEEELRLMYVASTRARKNLFFTYPTNVYDKISRMTLFRPSIFLDAVPDHMIEKRDA